MNNAQRGFTLVELITVMALIGILSAVAFSRFSNPDVYRQALFVNKVQAYLQFAQQLAMTQQLHSTKSSGSARFSLMRESDAQWLVIIANQLDSTRYPLAANLDILIDQQPLNIGQQLDLSFDISGNIVSQSFPPAADISFSIALQIGDQALCIAPTGFSYEGPCI